MDQTGISLFAAVALTGLLVRRNRAGSSGLDPRADAEGLRDVVRWVRMVSWVPGTRTGVTPTRAANSTPGVARV
jgi:hypothetical protein